MSVRPPVLGRGAAMIIESLRLFYHIDCFRCCVCCVQLGDGLMGTDVRVRNSKLHCHSCYSNDEGMLTKETASPTEEYFSKVAQHHLDRCIVLPFSIQYRKHDQVESSPSLLGIS